jgi:uncharacterized protein (TIGR02996 family)
MSGEDGFLRALQDDPADRATLRAYADWLQERGDPRAEYVAFLAETGWPRQGVQDRGLVYRMGVLANGFNHAWRDLVGGRACAPDLATLLALGRWLFVEFQHAIEPQARLAVGEEHGRRLFLEDALARLRDVMRPTAGWRAFSDWRPAY